MRLVADESCDFEVVRGLRSAGHDVTSIAEILTGADDEKVIDPARSERRLLSTEDKDLGQLVFSAAQENSDCAIVPLSGPGAFCSDRLYTDAAI